MVLPLENILTPEIRIFSQDLWEVGVAPCEQSLEVVPIVPSTVQAHTKIRVWKKFPCEKPCWLLVPEGTEVQKEIWDEIHFSWLQTSTVQIPSPRVPLMHQCRSRHFMAWFVWPVLDEKNCSLAEPIYPHESSEQPTWQLCCRDLLLVRWILSLVAFSSPRVHKLRQIQSAVKVGFQISVWRVYRRLSPNLCS